MLDNPSKINALKELSWIKMKYDKTNAHVHYVRFLSMELLPE